MNEEITRRYCPYGLDIHRRTEKLVMAFYVNVKYANTNKSLCFK